MTLARLLLVVSFALIAGCSPAPHAGTGPEHFLASDIDTSVSPRVDFFRYANGGWLKANPIPPSERGWGVGNLVQEETYARLRGVCEESAANTAAPKGSDVQKIGDYYAAATDTVAIDRAGTAPLRADLERIDAIADVNGLREGIAHIQTYGADPLFALFVGQDEKNSAAYSLHLYQGGIGLPNRDYYVNTDARTENIRREYVSHIAAILMLLGEPRDSAAEHSGAIMALETRLAKASRKLEDLRDPYRNYNRMSLRELDGLAPSLGWRTLLRAMSVGVDTVVVGQPEFFREADRLLRTRPLEEWKEYLRWSLVSHFAPALSSPFEREHFHFYQTILSGVKEPRPRWKRALDAEERAMGDMLGRLFVERYVPPSMKARYTALVGNIFAAYASRISALDWMSATTKEKALAKLKSVTRKVCYPDRWKDYSALQVDRSSYCANQIRAGVWEYNYRAAKLGKPVDRTEWEMTPQTYNAYYNPSNNEIVLPAAGLMIPGVPDSLVDDAVIYGYAGASTIGHEVTHGFDDEGRQFDDAGNLRNWWTKEDEKRFNEKAKVMIDQFQRYVVLDSLHVNGKASLGENIADLGGVVIGYEAFKKTREGSTDTLIDGLTPDQRFFLAYAYSWLGQIRDEALARQVMTDVHSPQFLRVNGPLADVPEFYRAFGVRPGDPMYRPDSVRVRIW